MEKQVVRSNTGTVHLLVFPTVTRTTVCGLSATGWDLATATFRQGEVLCRRCETSTYRHGFALPLQEQSNDHGNI